MALPFTDPTQGRTLASIDEKPDSAKQLLSAPGVTGASSAIRAPLAKMPFLAK